VAIQSDGKIVIGGSDVFGTMNRCLSLPGSTRMAATKVCLTRPPSPCNPEKSSSGALESSCAETNGQLDSAFGIDGVALLVSRSVIGTALQPTGKILIGAGGTPFSLDFALHRRTSALQLQREPRYHLRQRPTSGLPAFRYRNCSPR
jgi:hypothetical protein